MKKILFTAIAMVAFGLGANAQSNLIPKPFQDLAFRCALGAQAHAESEKYLNPDMSDEEFDQIKRSFFAGCIFGVNETIGRVPETISPN